MAEKKAKKTTKKTVAAETASTKPATTENRTANLRAPLAACVAELVGTFMFAAAVIVVQGQQLFVMFALIAIVLVVGQLSGAHVNPAITFGAWVTRNITGLRALGYVVAQFVGAMLAVVVLTALLDKTPQANPMGGAAQSPELFKAAALQGGREWFAFFAEILGATIFGFGVAAAMRQTERMAAAFMVGGSLFIGLLIGGATVVLNPAVALSIQALDFGKLPTLGVYAVATLIGGALGFLLYKYLSREVNRTA
jgi:aquaporin Z